MISICITCKDRSKLQAGKSMLYLLPNCIDSIIEASRASQIPVEIVITDWNSTDWPLNDWLPEKIDNSDSVSCAVVMISKEKFSLGFGRNVASKYASNDLLFFLDADMILKESMLRDAVDGILNNKVIFPVCCDEYTGEERHGAFGNAAMSRSHFKLLGKWAETTKWGGEDLEYYNKCKEMNVDVVRKVYKDLIHQWHPKKTGWDGEHVSKRYRIHPQKLKRMEVIKKKKKKHREILKKREARAKKRKDNKKLS